MSTTQTIDPADVICGLKAAVTALECYHDMEMRKQLLQSRIEKSETCTAPRARDQDYRKHSVLVERKSTKPYVETQPCAKRKHSVQDEFCPSSKTAAKKCKREALANVLFPEMRGGVLFTRCNCVHRDGLQDDCPLTQCQGQEECLVKPWPVCPPGCYFRNRHPDVFSPAFESTNDVY